VRTNLETKRRWPRGSKPRQHH